MKDLVLKASEALGSGHSTGVVECLDRISQKGLRRFDRARCHFASVLPGERSLDGSDADCSAGS